MAEVSPNSTVKCTLIPRQFVVPDVVAAAEYYRDILGFRILGYFLEPPVFAMVARDSVAIHFSKLDEGCAPAPNVTRREGSLDAYIWVNNLDLLFAELKDCGARILEPPVMRVYKCYEMVVEDKFGYRLAFSMDFGGEGK